MASYLVHTQDMGTFKCCESSSKAHRLDLRDNGCLPNFMGDGEHTSPNYEIGGLALEHISLI